MRLLLAQALEDLVDAVGEVKGLQERNAEADRNAQIDVSVEVPSAIEASICCQPKCCTCSSTFVKLWLLPIRQ